MDLSLFRLKSQPVQRTLFSTAPGSALPFLRIRVAGSKADEQEATVELLNSKDSNRVRLAEVDTGATSSGSAPSGIQSMLLEIRERSRRIESLQKAREGIANGSQQYLAYTDEIAAEESALRSVVSGDSFSQLQQILGQVNDGFARGTQSIEMAAGLSGSSSLLGNDFLSRVARGDSASVSMLGGYIQSIASAVNGEGERDGAFFSLIDSAVSGALRSLQGPAASASGVQSFASPIAQLVAPTPDLQQIGLPGDRGLSIGIQGYFGANAVQAALAHVEYDPKKAIVLLFDKQEDPDMKQKEKEEEDKEQVQRFTSGLREL